jgi:hypothetical protein
MRTRAKLRDLRWVGVELELAESKGSPRIDWETVWCMER